MDIVPEYVSSDESSSDEGPSPKAKKRRVSRTWLLEKTFETLLDAEQSVMDSGCWTKNSDKNTIAGQKVTYYCNQVPFKKRGSCPAGVYLLYHAENNKVSLFKTDSEHANHESVTRGIPSELRNVIEKLFDEGTVRPLSILATLKKRGLPVPQKTQLNNFLSLYRKKKYGQCTISVHELENWCDTRKAVPSDPDQPFVVDSNISIDLDMDHPQLQIFMSTTRLLELTKHNKLIQADTTYKLVWQGYPVFMVGTSDKNRAFHPFGLAVCYSESTEDFEFIFRSVRNSARSIFNFDYKPSILLADGSSAITKGFEAVFGNAYTRLMCWFHVIKKVDEKMRSIDKAFEEEIRNDICTIQLSSTHEMFDLAVDLFYVKWTSKNDSKVSEFLTYFQKEWLNQNRLWFEGAALESPSTNNGIEGTNSVVKKSHTFRERFPVGQFLNYIEMKLLHEWSVGRDSSQVNHKLYADVGAISTKHWTKAYQWAFKSPKLLSEKTDNGLTFYYVSASSQLANNKPIPITQAVIDKWKDSFLRWSSFDEFKESRHILWKISIEGTNWKSAKCSCPRFLKEVQCKHTLGLSIRLRLVEAPPEAKSVALGQKRKRGRPSHAKAALVRQ